MGVLFKRVYMLVIPEHAFSVVPLVHCHLFRDK